MSPSGLLVSRLLSQLPSTETSAEFPMAGCLVLMASSQICFPFAEFACDAAFHSTSPDCQIYDGASSNDGKMNPHSLKTFSPEEVMDP